jgi:hypothetical protein
MLKKLTAALFAACVIATPALAAGTSATEPAPVQTGKSDASGTRHHVRHVRHAHHLRHREKHVHGANHGKHAEHATGMKQVDKTAAPTSPGRAATTPANR